MKSSEIREKRILFFLIELLLVFPLALRFNRAAVLEQAPSVA